MLTISDLVVLILTCITFLPRVQSSGCPSGIQSTGIGVAFGVILPAFMGIGTHFLERTLIDRDQRPFFGNVNHRSEAKRFINAAALAGISCMMWSVMHNIVKNDIRMSLVLLSAYSYSHGRAYFMQRQSSLLTATSQLLPAAVGVVACSRIPAVAQQINKLGKSLLVLGLPA